MCIRVGGVSKKRGKWGKSCEQFQGKKNFRTGSVLVVVSV